MAFDTAALMGDLVLALGGAIGGALVAAVIAAVSGRNLGVVPLLLGLVVGGAGLPLGWRLATHPPSLAGLSAGASSPGKASNVAALGDDAVIEALKRYYPDDYAKLTGGPGGQWGAMFRARAIAGDLVRRRAPYADDENMMAIVRMARDEAGAARASSPRACSEALSGSISPSSSLMSGSRRAETAALLVRFLEQTATHPASSHATVDIQPALGRMVQSALRRLPQSERKLIDARFSFSSMAVDRPTLAARCDFAIAAFDELLARSPHESAGVMRTLMLKQGL